MNQLIVALISVLTIISIASALDCTNQPVAFFCKGTGFALCLFDNEYDYACAAGTACQCGEGVECDTPCTMACETGDRNTDAVAYCQARLGQFAGQQQGYFCDALGGGFYQCVRDAYCPESASPQSAYQHCPDGTLCACGDTYMECSLASQRTPCLYNTSYVPLTTQPLTTQPLTTQPLTTQPLTTQPLTTQPLTTQPLTTQPLTTQPLTTQPLTTQHLTTKPQTTAALTTHFLTTQGLTTQSQVVQTPHQQNECGSYRWDCINFSQGDVAHGCTDNTCGNVGDGGFCFWDLGTQAGACAGDIYCSGSIPCNSESQCPPNYMCLINTCCGSQGVCGPVCNSK